MSNAGNCSLAFITSYSTNTIYESTVYESIIYENTVYESIVYENTVYKSTVYENHRKL